MIRLLISGYSGFMGKTVRNLAEKSDIFEIVGGVDKLPENGNYPVFPSFDAVDVSADVIIDFGAPALTDSLLAFCERTHTAAVICTTGLTDATKENIKKVSQSTAIFYSANMSVGANLLAELCRIATRLLTEDFDIEIIEAHHKRKLDAPSGTAYMIADEVKKGLADRGSEEYGYCYDRHDKREPRPVNEIGMHAVRGGGIVGDHEVKFISDNEVITLSHNAISREVFASGALRAAKFLAGKEPGLYDMAGLFN